MRSWGGGREHLLYKQIRTLLLLFLPSPQSLVHPAKPTSDDLFWLPPLPDQSADHGLQDDTRCVDLTGKTMNGCGCVKGGCV